jgi:16S rRNA (guanine1207-N2)-methyltransferase
MFSHDRIDPGSRLLAGHLPTDLRGAIADFGAGWGFLSAAVLARCPAVKRLDLYEADFESLEAARLNLAPRAENRRLDFLWRDLLGEPAERRYDAVVMNPPFHRERAADPSIGNGMIRAAGRALKPGGRLLMVANRALPYERVLDEVFAEWRELSRDASFKLFEARL